MPSAAPVAAATPAAPPEAVAALRTPRDLLRYAVSRFRAAGVEHGHGARDAVDEAAFMILEALSLPVDDINPWLDARLLPAERARIIGLIERRCTTREPAAYVMGASYLQGVRFRADARAIVPRSYLAELLFKADGPLYGEGFALLDPAAPPVTILDLCCGGGSLAILAAMLFPDAAVVGVDLSADALALAAENVADHGLSDRITLRAGDLFAPLGGERFALILANPPYVSDRLVAGFPPEHRHEPLLAHAGGPDGLAIVHRILAGARHHLTPGGLLLCEVGEAGEALAGAYPDLPFLWLDTETSEGEVFALRAEDLP